MRNGRVGLLHAALRGEQVHDLRDEERVPLRLGVDRIDEARRRLDPCRELHVLRHVRRAKAAERDLGRVRLAHELGQCGCQRIPQRRIDVAVGADDEQAAVFQPARDEPKEQERGFVGCVQVVEHHDERAGLGGA